MMPKVAKSFSLNMCLHRTTKGRRCRVPVQGNASLCFRHAALHDRQPEDTDLSAALLIEPIDFQSAVYINGFLAKLTVHLVKNGISTRRAAVLAYLSNLLLRSLREIDHENDHDETHREIIFDLPRPDRSDEPENESVGAGYVMPTPRT